jgi:hypothetical protein
MNTPQSLKQPPWSGQAVSMWVRVLAGFFVVCGLLAGLTAAVAANTDLFPHGKAPELRSTRRGVSLACLLARPCSRQSAENLVALG